MCSPALTVIAVIDPAEKRLSHKWTPGVGEGRLRVPYPLAKFVTQCLS
jgi:hypothetical protein